VVVGRSKALTDACDRLAELKEQIAEKKKYDAEIRPRLSELSKTHAELTVELGNMKREQTRLRLTANKIEQKLEEFWENDPGQVKQRYLRCTKALEDFNIDQYFLFRNHRVPPEFTRKIVESMCFILLKEGDSEEKYMRMGWTRLQMIVSDPKYNSREGTFVCSYVCMSLSFQYTPCRAYFVLVLSPFL